MTDFAQRRTMMVDTQVRPNEVTSYPVIDAMLTVPREQFVPDALRNVAYAGENIDLGHNRVELEPRTLGRMLEALDIQSSDLVLHVACGYGYATAVMARIAEAVVATEENSEMASEAQSRLAAQDIYNVAVTEAALTAGFPGQAPYDAMLIGGAIETLPETLADQLREGGRIVALFVEGQLGTVRLGHKLDGQITWRNVFNAFAPILPGFKRVSSFAL